MFENMVLRRIFGPRRDEVTGEWRRLHNEKLNDILLLTQYCAGDKIEKNEMGWACGAYGGGEGMYRVLVGKPEGKRPLGRPRRRWVDNIRTDLQEVGYGSVEWIGLA